MKKQQKILERHIEQKVVDYAKERGCLVRKMNGLGNMNWPDRMFVGPKGEVFFIEFKRPGGLPTPGQTMLIDELYARGVRVIMTDNIITGRQFVDDVIGPPAHEGH